jgi:hypothetical protein
LDAAALVHPGTLEEARQRHLEHARRAPQLERPETAEELMRSDPAMPRAVAEYQASRSAEMRRRFPPPRLSDGFARVETLAELEALSAKEMFARFLEATDWRNRAARQIERGGGTVTPEGRAHLPRNRHEVLGAVPDGPDAAYVVYRIIHVGDGPREVQTLPHGAHPRGLAGAEHLLRRPRRRRHADRGVGRAATHHSGEPMNDPSAPERRTGGGAAGSASRPYSRPRMSPLGKAGLAVTLVAAVGGVLFAAGRGVCDNTPLAEVPSPGGTRKAVVFERSCGATTGFSTQVSVLPAGEKPRGDAGNVFVADTDHGAAPSGPGGGPVVEPVWIAEDRLLIRHHRLARVFLSEARAGSVAVSYEAR